MLRASLSGSAVGMYTQRIRLVASLAVALGLVALGLWLWSGDTPRPHPLALEALLPTGLELRAGDLVCREGTAWYSPHIRQRMSREQIFSHVGILAPVARGGALYVWHMELDDDLGHHGLVREPLEVFAQHGTRLGLYRPRLPIDEGRLVRDLDSLGRLRLGFDDSFGDASPTTYYCTELVACLLAPHLPMPISPSYSLLGRQLYTLDDLLDATHAQLLYLTPHY